MLAPKNIGSKFITWNWKYHAPYGRTILKEWIPQRLWDNPVFASWVGVFSFQPNSDSRRFEYPWAFYATALAPQMNILDLGAGYSGFPFVLSKLGMNVVIVDPFVNYGPSHHYSGDPNKVVAQMNKCFGTKVDLKRNVLEEANLGAGSFDRIFCISAIEHIPFEGIQSTFKEIQRILKPGGELVLTVDLFLNLTPFTKRSSNEFGQNVSIKELVEMSRLELVQGNKNELYGYDEFDSKKILENLDKYYLASAYPVLTQCLVLRKNG